MLASESGHTEALALLLANGANVNAAMHVIQNLYAMSHEFDRLTSQNLSVSLTRFAFEFRMDGLPLCMLHEMGTLRLLRFS
jgi:hypothetical protein